MVRDFLRIFYGLVDEKTYLLLRNFSQFPKKFVMLSNIYFIYTYQYILNSISRTKFDIYYLIIVNDNNYHILRIHSKISSAFLITFTFFFFFFLNAEVELIKNNGYLLIFHIFLSMFQKPLYLFI
jgi:hypothetical protein